MADISKITMPVGDSTVTYNIKDATARTDIGSINTKIQTLEATVKGGVTYLGKLKEGSLTDNDSTSTITVDDGSLDGKTITLSADNAGAMAIYDNKEFIWNGALWQELGSTGSLKALAFKDSASGSVTATGTVSKPVFTGESTTISVTHKPAGTVTIGVGTGTANYTPTGSVNSTFSGSASTIKGTCTPEGTIGVGSGTANYTPAGSVSQPTATVNPTTASITPIATVGTLPSWTGEYNSETEALTFSWNAGTLPTKGEAVSAMTSASVAVSQPTFSGAGVQLTFTGDASSATTASYTPSGSIASEFSGNGSEITASFEGQSETVSTEYTPVGSVSQPIFTGDEKTVTVQ